MNVYSFKRSRKTDKHEFTMEENIIEVVQSYKYLGVLMSNNGSLLNARKCIFKKANKAMHLLYKWINNLNLPLDLQLKLLDSTILPIITSHVKYGDMKMCKFSNVFTHLS